MARRKSVATKVSCQRVQKNPYMADDRWRADHWRCTVARRGKRMSVYFSKGYGHHGEEPTSSEIIETIALDALGFENANDFHDWAREYGFDTTSRHARKVYNAVEKQTVKLRRVLGDALYERVVYGKR
jgi:hypothetical protein